MNASDSIPTRQSLLVRLNDWGDQESWRQFFDTYWKLIHTTAVRAGLGVSEAEEVVQDVMIAAAKKLPEFHYEPGKDSMKGWLLAITRWKVADQFRRRNKPGSAAASDPTTPPSGEDTASTATVDRVADPDGPELEAIWEGEWRENLLRAVLDRVKARVNPSHYEMYHLHVVRGLPARETARALGVGAAAVHLAKHRVGRLVKAELRRSQNAGRDPA